MSVPDVVRKLVERFEEHEAEYRHSYSEAQVRQAGLRRDFPPKDPL
jgi:hypothetical protein